MPKQNGWMDKLKKERERGKRDTEQVRGEMKKENSKYVRVHSAKKNKGRTKRFAMNE